MATFGPDALGTDHPLPRVQPIGLYNTLTFLCICLHQLKKSRRELDYGPATNSATRQQHCVTCPPSAATRGCFTLKLLHLSSVIWRHWITQLLLTVYLTTRLMTPRAVNNLVQNMMKCHLPSVFRNQENHEKDLVFMANKVELGQVFHRLLRVSPANIIRYLVHAHSMGMAVFWVA